MSLVQARIRGVEGLQKLIATKQKELTRLQTELATRTKLLQDEIAKGGTTGENLRDLVIRIYGFNDEILAQFRTLQERLNGHKGEFVMIRYAVEVRQRFGGDIRERDFLHEQHFRIGILAGEELCYPKTGTPGLTQGIDLPIDHYLPGIWEWGGLRILSAANEPALKGGKGGLFEWVDAEDQPPRLTHYMTDEQLVKNLFIGDEAVEAEFVRICDKKFFATAAKRLGRLILQPTD